LKEQANTCNTLRIGFFMIGRPYHNAFHELHISTNYTIPRTTPFHEPHIDTLCACCLTSSINL